MGERDGTAAGAVPGGEDGGAAGRSRWRVVRWVTVLVLGILMFLAVLQDPLSAAAR